jgi:hypothetical protein
MCRLNIKRNFYPTTRNENFHGRDSDSVRSSLSVETILSPSINLTTVIKTIAQNKGQQLGAGCFGQVVMAEAVGLGGTETLTTVAVKMIRATAQSNEALTSLIRELKFSSTWDRTLTSLIY